MFYPYFEKKNFVTTILWQLITTYYYFMIWFESFFAVGDLKWTSRYILGIIFGLSVPHSLYVENFSRIQAGLHMFDMYHE